MLNQTRLLILLVALLSLAACASLESGILLPSQHPPEAELGHKPPNCLDCHEERNEKLPFERFVHNAYFMDNHRQLAYQRAQVCSMCHARTFCNDCHATRVELKPSIKNETETNRRMPHRGDFLSRHRIEGRVDPTSCLRCHGNPKSATRCAACHG